jgi:Phosphoesterase family
MDLIRGAVEIAQVSEVGVATGTVSGPGEGDTDELGAVAEAVEVTDVGAPETASVPVASRRRSQHLQADLTLDNLHKISHIIVLMMENRSFDHMLGYLRLQGNQDIDGLTGMETNPNRRTEGTPVRVGELRNSLFASSPHHDYLNVLRQVNGGNMDGFVDNYLQRYDTQDPRLAMGYYTDEFLDVYDDLAGRFTVCDRWFCAFPGGTMPNRVWVDHDASSTDLVGRGADLGSRLLGHVVGRRFVDRLDRYERDEGIVDFATVLAGGDLVNRSRARRLAVTSNENRSAWIHHQSQRACLGTRT